MLGARSRSLLRQPFQNASARSSKEQRPERDTFSSQRGVARVDLLEAGISELIGALLARARQTADQPAPGNRRTQEGRPHGNIVYRMTYQLTPSQEQTRVLLAELHEAVGQ